MDDSKIIELYFLRDEDAIRKTDEKYGGYCQTVAYNVLADMQEAEECKNDTYFKLWSVIPPTVPKIFSAFIAKITRNLALDRCKSKNRAKRGGRVALSLDELEECVGEEGVLDRINAEELGKVISDFLRSESEKARIIFIKRYFFEESVSNIAKSLGISETSVKTGLSRTRARLLKHLKSKEVCF